MALERKRSGLKSRATDVLFGSAVAGLLIGAAMFGEPGPAQRIAHPMTYGSAQGLAHAVRPTHCRNRIAPACVKGHCVPLPRVRCSR